MTASAFAAVTFAITYFAEDYLVGLRVRDQLKNTNQVSVSMAPHLHSGNAKRMFDLAEESSLKYGGRFLVLNKSGIVQTDSFSILGGRKLEYKEISDVLLGPADTSYGFYEIDDGLGEPFFAVYYTSAIVYDTQTIGAVLFAADIQDVVNLTREFVGIVVLIAAGACIIIAALCIVISGYITRPINELKSVAMSISRGNLHQRIRVTGKSEMAALADTFNTMSERLENLDRKRSEFVSNASHELKTPLSSMKILIESLLYQDGVDETIYKEFLSDINKEIDRLSEVISGLLTLAKTDSETEALRLDKILLSELLYKSVAALKPIAGESGILLSYSVQNDMVIECDALKVMQAVMNLIDNAIKYTDKGGSISVTLQKSGVFAAVSVKDNGCGIPESEIEHIFDRFYRIDKARARGTGGSGLGLHIARKIALLHGGSIEVKSEEGRGSVFTLYLPKTI
ncbi:MAG: HAMP domain-containing sensor histidine kinase [Christensenellales bacterium]